MSETSAASLVLVLQRSPAEGLYSTVELDAAVENSRALGLERSAWGAAGGPDVTWYERARGSGDEWAESESLRRRTFSEPFSPTATPYDDDFRGAVVMYRVENDLVLAVFTRQGAPHDTFEFDRESRVLRTEGVEYRFELGPASQPGGEPTIASSCALA